MVQVAVTVAPVVVAPRNARRQTITFFNSSLLGEIIMLSKYGPFGLALANTEYVLQPGVQISFMYAFDGADIQGEWGGFATAATATVIVGETATRDR